MTNPHLAYAGTGKGPGRYFRPGPPSVTNRLTCDGWCARDSMCHMTLTCDTCGGEFTARAGARYCSGRCRTLAYRERRDGPKPKRPRAPLPDALSSAWVDLDRALRRLDVITQDDRMPKFSRNHPRALATANDMERCARMLDVIRARLPEASQPSRP